MKHIINLIAVIIIILTMMMILIILFPDIKTDRQICIEKGGIPIMNWNNSALRDCKRN